MTVVTRNVAGFEPAGVGVLNPSAEEAHWTTALPARGLGKSSASACAV